MSENYRFEKLSSAEGLSNNIIVNILQDSKGFMWIGTNDGLNRFDGREFKVFKKNDSGNSLPTNTIQALFEDSEKNLWIGTTNLGLTVFNPEYNTFKRIYLHSKFYQNSVTEITEDSKGNMWVGTYGSGLYRIADYEVAEHYCVSNEGRKTISCNIINTLLFDNDTNDLYIGGWSEGISVLNTESMEFRYLSHKENDENSLSDNRTKFIIEDSKQRIWITTHNGLTCYDKSRDKFERYYHNENDSNSLSSNVITGICEDFDGILWIGTRNNGIIRFDVKNNKFDSFKYNRLDKYSISSNEAMLLFRDRTNVVWVGTWGEGLCKIDCSQKKFKSVSNNALNNENNKLNRITSILIDSEKNYWYGTQSDGVYLSNYKNEEFEFRQFEHINHKLICGIVEDKNKNIWYSTQLHGICSYNLLTKEFSVHGNEELLKKDKRTFNICIDPVNNNILWVGTESTGIFKFDIVTKIFSRGKLCDELYDVTVYCLFLSEDGLLWIGTHGMGLYLLNTKSDDLLKKYTLTENSIWCICSDESQNIWFGTTNNGLYKLDRSEDKLYNFNENDGLPNNSVFGLQFDAANNLWISTGNGISKFDPKNEKFTNYEFRDGLQGNDFNCYSYFKTDNNILHFGGMDGITYFQPDEIKDNPYIPNIAITDFEIFNQPVTGSPDNPFLKKSITYADEINLTYRESVFSFKFASLIFNNPQKNQYAYKMEGFDKDWTFSGARRRVTYTNLNPGDYVFRVKGSNNDGVWNEEGTSVKIHISPPYWKTVWFKGLSLLGIVGAVSLAYRQRLEKLENETRAQEEFSRKLIEAQENERKRIAHELHDTIAHEVLISKNKALLALKHKSDKDRMEKALEEISEMSSATITEVRNIAYNMHPHQLERLGFTKTIRSIINDVSKSTNINFVFDTDNVDELLSKESEINLFRVVQETISNIVKHSKATEVILKVMKTENNLEILLVDNGKGFDLRSKAFNDARQGFGLSGIEERIKFMNGEIRIDSELNKGTTLKFKIPIVK